MSRRDSRRKRTKWLRKKPLPTTVGKYVLEDLIGKVIRFGKSQHPEQDDMIGFINKYELGRVILPSKYVRKGLPKTFYCAYLTITIADEFIIGSNKRQNVYPLYPFNGVYDDDWRLGPNITIKEIYDEFEQIIKKLEYNF